MKNMRKMFALAMVALLALTLALTVVGCAQQSQEAPSTTEVTPPADMPMDNTMSSDSMMVDTSTVH
ncbi:MAG: hypothetical protein ABIS67_10015 [Candidatus Eisenbacteria bacterium]